MIVLKEKLYTSEETAGVLGVTTRTLYRYVKNGEIDPETKTKSGTYRFNRTEIYKYLYPDKYKQILELLRKREGNQDGYEYIDDSNLSSTSSGGKSMQPVSSSNSPKKRTASNKGAVEKPALDNSSSKNADRKEPTSSPKIAPDDFSKALNDLNESLNSSKENNKDSSESTKTPQQNSDNKPNINDTPTRDSSKPSSKPTLSSETSKKENLDNKPRINEKPKASASNNGWNYYSNPSKDILQIAREVNSLSTETGRKYASTMQGGLSLHHEIDEFHLVHFYVEPDDLNWWAKQLELEPSKKEEANICLIKDSDGSILNNSYKLRGLYVVDDQRLIQDLMRHGEKELARSLV